jgi:hypothetical protein
MNHIVRRWASPLLKRWRLWCLNWRGNWNYRSFRCRGRYRRVLFWNHYFNIKILLTLPASPEDWISHRPQLERWLSYKQGTEVLNSFLCPTSLLPWKAIFCKIWQRSVLLVTSHKFYPPLQMRTLFSWFSALCTVSGQVRSESSDYVQWFQQWQVNLCCFSSSVRFLSLHFISLLSSPFLARFFLFYLPSPSLFASLFGLPIFHTFPPLVFLYVCPSFVFFSF